MQFRLIQLFAFVTAFAFVTIGLFRMPPQFTEACTFGVLCGSFAGMPFAAMLKDETANL